MTIQNFQIVKRTGQRYPEVVREDLATDGTTVFLAEIPSLPGCMSHGDTPEEALRNVWEAAELYVETLVEQGQRPPAPPALTVTSGTGVANSHIAMARPRIAVDAEVNLTRVS